MSGEKRIKEDNRPTQRKRRGEWGTKSWIKQTSWIEMTSIKLNLTEVKTGKEGVSRQWPVWTHCECWTGDLAGLPMRAALGLKEPCLRRERQILQSNMYEATHLFTHTHTFFSVSPSHLHANTGHSGDSTVAQKTHMKEQTNIKTPSHTQTHTHKGIKMIYLQFNTCAVGPRGSPVCVAVCAITRHSTPLPLFAVHNKPHTNQLRGHVHLSRRSWRIFPGKKWPVWH